MKFPFIHIKNTQKKDNLDIRPYSVPSARVLVTSLTYLALGGGPIGLVVGLDTETESLPILLVILL